MRTLILLLFVTFSAAADPGRVRLDGAAPTRDGKPPMSYFSGLKTAAIVVGREGFVIPQNSGYAASQWSQVKGLERRGSLARLLLRDSQKVSFSLDGSRPDLPCLVDGKGFLAALPLDLKLTHQEKNGYRRYSAVLKPKNNLPEQPIGFQATGLSRCASGWPPSTLAALSPQPAITLNEHGIVRVTPHSVESVRWEKAQELTVYPGLVGVTDPMIAVLDKPKDDTTEHIGLVLRPEDRFFLPPLSFHKLGTLLPGLQAKGHLRAPARPVFMPLHTCDPNWATKADRPDNVPSQPLEREVGLWPYQLDTAGIYLLPAGLVYVRGFVVESLPWVGLRSLDGRPDGSMKLNSGRFELFPSSPDEVPVFRQARRDIIEAAGLQLNGQPSPVYLRRSDASKIVIPHFYPLGEHSAWTGLPLSRLGPTRWAPGLYLLHEGLISVQQHRVGLAPWTQVQKIGLADWGQGGHCLRVQLTEWGMRTFPAGAQDAEVALPLGALTTLERYVDIQNFVPTLRPDRPATPTFVPYVEAKNSP